MDCNQTNWIEPGKAVVKYILMSDVLMIALMAITQARDYSFRFCLFAQLIPRHLKQLMLKFVKLVKSISLGAITQLQI